VRLPHPSCFSKGGVLSNSKLWIVRIVVSLLASRATRSGRGVEAAAHGVHYFASRRKHAQRSQGASVHNDLVIHQNFEFAIVAADHLDVGLQFTTEARRHPDGVQSGDSIDTIANGNSCHWKLLRRAVAQGRRADHNGGRLPRD
jgi:hypothetical protein